MPLGNTHHFFLNWKNLHLLANKTKYLIDCKDPIYFTKKIQIYQNKARNLDVKNEYKVQRL